MSHNSQLHALADAYGVATSYTSATGEHMEVSDDTIRYALAALGINVDDNEEAAAQAIKAKHDADFSRPLPPCVVATHGYPYVVHIHVHDGEPAELLIALEEGGEVTPTQVDNWTPPRTIAGITWGEASFELPADLPMGWHRLYLHSTGIDEVCDLIVTPRALDKPTKKRTGVMAQLYSTRSQTSWGMGDFHDLATLGTIFGQHKQDFILINPLHAAEPFPPCEDSPYLPTTRRFINPIYLHIEDIPELTQLEKNLQEDVKELAQEFTALNHSADYIERDPIYEAKLQVLRELHTLPRTDAREAAYQAYLVAEGEGLQEFATWCAQRDLEHHASSHSQDPEMEELVDFYCWLQFLCDEQLQAAQKAATDAGMDIGIMADLAVGVHPGGADAFTMAEYLAPDASVGAPPDGYNQHGQDWSQPPWHPIKLAEAGYRPWRDLLRTVLRHSGGIRVDHVLGLFRLWWIPRGGKPTDGTYVRYNHDAMVGILCLEAHRAGAVVIGEDLGTFEPWIQDYLADRGLMGTSIIWFEGDPEIRGPRRQEKYRELALTSVTTHDLPPTAGYLDGEHIRLRDRLGLFTTKVEDEDEVDLVWQNEVLDRVREAGYFGEHESFIGKPRDQRGSIHELLTALHRFMAGTSSLLACTALVDLVGDTRAQNQPGTTKDLYPNWCVPLADANQSPILIEDITSLPLAQALLKASQR
ncbi:4-alpha-glucanotransferase [Corynebacterium aquilae]|uniref:4-alpha-glucanotransferase n=1 Tax=Corynebacterium aquilae DSM 44791 TaxID=1431546 RepID=A0A1L7CH61_9CORY|nr:4-alpha-glucanotransferase [Corynebacterium aquilae]APT85200.1 4-alpha-glucanotransferase [Corynebacterium aquilae DSM 44791]